MICNGNSVVSLVMKAGRVCHHWEENRVVLGSLGQADLSQVGLSVPLVLMAGSQLGERLPPAC